MVVLEISCESCEEQFCVGTKKEKKIQHCPLCGSVLDVEEREEDDD